MNANNSLGHVGTHYNTANSMTLSQLLVATITSNNQYLATAQIESPVEIICAEDKDQTDSNAHSNQTYTAHKLVQHSVLLSSIESSPTDDNDQAKPGPTQLSPTSK